MKKKLIVLLMLCGCATDSSSDDLKQVSLDLNKEIYNGQDSILTAVLNNTSDDSIFVLKCQAGVVFRRIDHWEMGSIDSQWVQYFGNDCYDGPTFGYIGVSASKPFRDTIQMSDFETGKYRYVITWIPEKTSEMLLANVMEFQIIE